MSLIVENLTFKTKQKSIIEDISFTCSKKDIVCIVGSNGAGKTTLLRTILNINKKSNGKVYLFGEDISSISFEDLSKKVAYKPQFSEVPNISVLEVLELGRRTFSKSILKKRDREIINKIIKEFNLENILQTNIATLSGGQRQKVFLASSLVQQPKLLVLDEPISHLDPKNQLDVLKVVRKVTKKREIITLIVIHDIQHALHYGDSLLMLKDKKVLYHIKKECVKEEHIDKTFDIKSKLFKQDRHTFVFYQHSHSL